jgi:uncharacterized membrane protein (DUF485 family)
MAHFDSSHAPIRETESADVAARNARYGLVLFFLYLAVYTGFVLLNAFGAEWMQLEFAGVSVAVLYGLALIVAAFLLSLVYGWLCRDR